MDREHAIALELIRSFRQLRHVQWRGRRPDEACTPSEMHMLFIIGKSAQGRGQGIKASEIAQTLRISLPTVTQMVNLLEARGLAERNPDPEDRRVVRITLTEAGKREMALAEEAMVERMRGLIGHLGEERARLLIDLLDEVYRYFHPGVRPHGKEGD